MMRGRVAAALAATAVVLAAAGTAAAVDPSAAPARGVTDTTITIGGLGDVARFPSAEIGARARFERANRGGGVHGRTFVYLGMRDDGGGAVGTQAATSLVRDDGVFAIVPVVTPDLRAAPDLVAQQVPYFGWAVSSNFCGTDWGFSFTGCTFPPGATTTSDVWGASVRQVLGERSAGTTAAVVGEDSDSGRYFVATLTAALGAADLDVVSGTTPLPVPAVVDYGVIAQQLLTANQGGPPDAIFVVASYANVAQLRQALRGAGYGGVFTNLVEYEPDLVASATGSYVLLPTAAVETALTNPGMARLVADVRAYAPGQPIDQSVLAGYWSADLFIAAVRRAGRQLTPETLVQRANAGFTYRVKNTVGPVRFPVAHDEPVPCGSLVESLGRAYHVAVPYRCGAVVDVGG